MTLGIVNHQCLRFQLEPLDVGFEIALERAFQHQLSAEMRSQLHLGRSSIARIGRDWELFARQAPKVYDAPVSEEELRSVWPLYSRVVGFTVTGRFVDGKRSSHLAR